MWRWRKLSPFFLHSRTSIQFSNFPKCLANFLCTTFYLSSLLVGENFLAFTGMSRKTIKEVWLETMTLERKSPRTREQGRRRRWNKFIYWKGRRRKFEAEILFAKFHFQFLDVCRRDYIAVWFLPTELFRSNVLQDGKDKKMAPASFRHHVIDKEIGLITWIRFCGIELVNWRRRRRRQTPAIEADRQSHAPLQKSNCS